MAKHRPVGLSSIITCNYALIFNDHFSQSNSEAMTQDFPSGKSSPDFINPSGILNIAFLDLIFCLCFIKMEIEIYFQKRVLGCDSMLE